MARILVVEDNQPVSRVVCEALSRGGHEPVAALTGEQGLHLAAEAPPALALLDLKLPGIDGIEVARRLRREWDKLPVVLMTAYSTLDALIEARSAGICHCIEKPFRSDMTSLPGLIGEPQGTVSQR